MSEFSKSLAHEFVHWRWAAVDDAVGGIRLCDQFFQDFLVQVADVPFPGLSFLDGVDSECDVDQVQLCQLGKLVSQQDIRLGSVGKDKVNLWPLFWFVSVSHFLQDLEKWRDAGSSCDEGELLKGRLLLNLVAFLSDKIRAKLTG